VGHDQRDIWRAAALLGSIGSVMALSVFAGFGIGYLLDKHFGTEPWLSVVGLLLGIAAGFREAFRIIRRFAKNF
jgi:ATP synthase protein I